MNKNDWSDIAKIFIWMALSVLLAFAVFWIFHNDEKPIEANLKEAEYVVIERIVAPAEEVNGDEYICRPRQKTEPVETVEAKVVVENIRAAAATVEYFNVPLSQELQNHIFAVCDDYSVDPALVIAMIFHESSYVTDIIGDNGNAFGLMQIQPRWHWDRMMRLGLTEADDLLDPYQNVTVGVDFIAELISYGRGVEWALMAYNGGPGKANIRDAKVVRYASNVFETRDLLVAG